MNLNCPFCSNQIKKHVFLETDNMFAAYNIAPILPGHSMVIPRRHVETIHELSAEELAELFIFSRDVTSLLTTVFDSVGFDWSLQESEAAGQSIKHVHLHIIPRKPNDLKQPGDWYLKLEKQRNVIIDHPDRKHLSDDEIQNMVSFILKHIR